MVRDNARSHKIDYAVQVQEILNHEGFKNCLIGSKVKAALMDWANRLVTQDINYCLG